MHKKTISEQEAADALHETEKEARRLLNDPSNLERQLRRIEEKLRGLPKVGTVLADIPLLISLVRAYIKKDYTDIPVGSILAAIGCLIYFLSPVDLIPDILPGIGYLDDAAVVAAAVGLIHSDLMEYKQYRDRRQLEAANTIFL